MRIALENGLALLGPQIHTIVISSEGSFLSGGTEALVDYLRDFNPELLIYFRRQDDWANSQYAEFAGGGALGRISSTPEDWLATRWTQDRLDYEKFLRRWLEKLPKAKVHVRPVERSGIREGVILDDFINDTRHRKVGPDRAERPTCGTNSSCPRPRSKRSGRSTTCRFPTTRPTLRLSRRRMTSFAKAAPPTPPR